MFAGRWRKAQAFTKSLGSSFNRPADMFNRNQFSSRLAAVRVQTADIELAAAISRRCALLFCVGKIILNKYFPPSRVLCYHVSLFLGPCLRGIIRYTLMAGRILRPIIKYACFWRICRRHRKRKRWRADVST